MSKPSRFRVDQAGHHIVHQFRILKHSDLLVETTFKTVFPFCPYTDLVFIQTNSFFFSYCAYFVGFVLFLTLLKAFHILFSSLPRHCREMKGSETNHFTND